MNSENKEDKVKKESGPIWQQLQNLKFEAWGLPKQDISEYFEPLLEIDKELLLKVKNAKFTRASSLISFLENSLEEKFSRGKFLLENMNDGKIKITLK